MLFFGIKNLWFKVGIFLPLTVAAILFVGWMYHNFYTVDPYDPNLSGTALYGHNGEGYFESYAELTFIEYIVLLGVLLPFSFSRLYFVRVLILQSCFGFWFFIMLVGSMHNGYVHIIHVFWLFTVNVILFLLLVSTIIAEAAARNKLRENASEQ